MCRRHRQPESLLLSSDAADFNAWTVVSSISVVPSCMLRKSQIQLPKFCSAHASQSNPQRRKCLDANIFSVTRCENLQKNCRPRDVTDNSSMVQGNSSVHTNA